MINKNDVLNVLSKVIDQNSNKNIVELGLVSSILVDNHNVTCILNLLNEHHIIQKDVIEKQCKDAINLIPNIKCVKVIITSTRSSHKSRYGETDNKISIQNVKNVILISSGKGGVGKSTVALNIALALVRKGYKTALVDLDIYGPSIPHMLGVIDGTNPEVDDCNRMLPITRYGLKSMSIGYLTSKKNAAIWRGPMITKAIYSLILNTVWGELDYLIIDTPPGTGDVHITLTSKFEITGIIIVSTPQELAIIDAVKMCDMMHKMKVRVIGVVENMSYFIDTNSGNKTYIFGKHGVRYMADTFNINFLGEIPIYPQICDTAESGNPLMLDSEICKIYNSIVDSMLCIVDSV
ncbi:Mrp protein [Ehrlichia ruminantium]|uniref:Iron-sulfur cluster carrier protein n=1 Tax=Ehrlichia ruminantium (strain Welgevonden) TaxID=254945 RepID=A0A0H3M205_EHRRW|nr:Mrp/NBP35 family ATP-binding protein [Ehrlichia ruminantium]KYW98996.1 ATPase [Ehrlichia ruminantium]QLK50878.1 Mrp/NBP35 family ATP-binding protein [Ehrlichia ruminantium]QLK51800.1 Mrp/NBP35 family ATP-binding protein [Ehrlichia ruminantium]QLK52718.1 Mrp/NBP35 family ATP-binding protein [Ehrlichia ruminantium]QLK53639.1 Mrp/NBP35 family ATP-binding protein [Ehrlichia ruminantium]